VVPLRIFIAGSRRSDRLELRSIFDSFADCTLVGEAASAPDAARSIQRHCPDLAVLETQLREGGGLGTVERLPRQQRPLVAFFGTNDRDALHAFELGAIDYVLKPVAALRLRETVDRARERLLTVQTARGSRGSAADLLPVRSGHEILLVPSDQILSVTADGDLVEITTTRNERHTVSTYRLKDIESRLDPALFVRLSRSALVNVRFIAKLSPLVGGTYLAVLTNRQEITVSRGQARALRQRLHV
jgi:two-component system, LytTR family, response regulator